MTFIKKCKSTATPIETSLGILKGRDCIFLDNLIKKENSFIFEGEINGRLLDNGKDAYIKYEFEFKKVVSMFTCELDTYDAMNTNSVYSFEIIENSKYLKNIAANDELDIKSLKHYRLKTYDDVFDIIAEAYVLKIGDNNE